MNKHIKVLLSSVGVATGPNVISALKKSSDVSIYIIAVDNDRLAAGLYLADSYHVISRIDGPSYMFDLINIIKKEKIDIYIPLLSHEIHLISEHRELLKENGVSFAIPNHNVIQLCEDKTKFSKFIHSNGLKTPHIYEVSEITDNVFPLFVKPKIGSSGRGCSRINNKKDWEYWLGNIPNKSVYSIQEYIDGPEYTIDVLCDLNGNLLTGVIRERLEIKDGKAVKCRTVYDETLWHDIHILLGYIKIIGPANIQCIKTSKGYVFLEINTRFSAGGLPLSTYAGINLPLLLVKMLHGIPIESSEMIYKDGIYMSRYLTEVFITQD